MPAAAAKAKELPEFLREGAEQRKGPKGQALPSHVRTATFNRESVDVENRTVEIAFATETAVERYWGREVLDLDPSSVRLARIQRGGALLMDHNWTDQVGVVDSVRIDPDKVARAVVRFGRSVRASEILQDVADGIRTNISFAYQIYAADLESKEAGVETYRITDWEPYEISFVSVPADINAGVGRAKPTPKDNTMPAEVIENREAPVVVDQVAIRAAGADSERKRSQDILAIAETYKRYNLHDLASEAIRSGMSLEEFKAKAMERMASAPKPNATIGMTEREQNRYSLIRALNFLANPTDAHARNAAAFEIECSQAAREVQGGRDRPNFNGIRVPYDVIGRGSDAI
jgi:hypothetical protein